MSTNIVQSNLEETLQGLYDQFYQICDTVRQISEEKPSEIVYSSELDQEVSELAQNRINEKVNDYRKNVEKTERIHSAFEVILSRYYSSEFVSEVMNTFRLCSENNNFQHMAPIYHQIKNNPSDRQIMKALVAMYCLNLRQNNYRYADRKHSYRSVIRYATNCSECGDRAKQIINDLISVGMSI